MVWKTADADGARVVEGISRPEDTSFGRPCALVAASMFRREAARFAPVWPPKTAAEARKLAAVEVEEV